MVVGKRKRPFPFMRGLLKVVPFTEIEWKYVQKKFMSENLDELEQMCDIMSMWTCRMWHDTPLIIGISELVLRAFVLNKRQQKQRQNQEGTGTEGMRTTLDNTDIGLIYGSVIIRFVNYVNEVCQPEGIKAMLSIAVAVRKMGIPSWIVHIRHQATHGQMPPMSLMMEAIKFCRKWLWKQHWSRPFNEAIKETLPHEVQEQQKEEQRYTMGTRIVAALARFKEWRRHYPSLADFHPPAATIEGQQQWQEQRVRLDVSSVLDERAEEFIAIFVESCLSQLDYPDIFFASDDAGNDLLEGHVMSNQKYLDNISEREQNYYRPILQLLNAKGCLPALLIEIVRQINCTLLSTELGFSNQRHLAGWANILLTAYLKKPESVSYQNWRIVLRHVVLAPQFFNNVHIKVLLNVANISEKCKRQITKLLTIRDPSFEESHCRKSSSVSSLFDLSTYSVKSLGDLQHRMIQQEQTDDTFVRDPLTMEEDWSLASADELGALGLTADQCADTLCLALGCDLY